MQNIFSIAALLIILSMSLVALEVQKSQKKDLGVDTLITKIKSAKPENRRVLMNQLKLQLRTMNKENRQKAMRDLRKSFGKKGQHKRMGKQRKKSVQQQQKANKPQHAGQHKGKR